MNKLSLFWEERERSREDEDVVPHLMREKDR